jgi:iron complex outermembrane receptor protein/hemoglobin/transferrin/lactoferrin receptor protein
VELDDGSACHRLHREDVTCQLQLNWRLGDQHELILATQYVRQYDVPKTSEVTLGDRLKFNYEPQQRELAYLEYRGCTLGIFELIKAIVDEDAPTLETREVTDVRTPGATLQLTHVIGHAHRLTYSLEYYRDRYDTSKEALDPSMELEAPLLPGTPDIVPTTTR